MTAAATTHRRPVCPADPSHGAVLDWPTSRWGFYCAHQDHDGWKERPATRAFFRTSEVERGALDPTDR